MDKQCQYLVKYFNLLKPCTTIKTDFMQSLQVQRAVLEHLVQCEMCKTTILTNHGITPTNSYDDVLKEMSS